MENKYTFSDASPEEIEGFKKGFDELLEKASLAVTVVINKKGMPIKNNEGKDTLVFVDEASLVVQKKTLIEDASAINDTEIVSPLSDEINGNEPTPTA